MFTPLQPGAKHPFHPTAAVAAVVAAVEWAVSVVATPRPQAAAAMACS